jgi:HAD superfamily hydrolase (TIGR01450 family)
VPTADGEALVAAHDALLVDLDGVVYLGDHVIPAAGPTLDEARARGAAVVFVTNNASRTADDVAAGLTRLGVTASGADVLTSSMAAADHLAASLSPNAAVLVVGGAGLRGPVAAAGLRPVETAEADPAAVVQGWAPDLTWALLAEGAVAIRRGARWVATNTDATLPSPRGPLPGNGAMVAAVRMATGADPEVVGKPAPTLFTSAAARVGSRTPLVIGDRLDTDIAGAVAAGMPSLLVLSGVSRLSDLLAAAPAMRPTYLAHDLGGVMRPAAAIADTVDVGDDLDRVRAVCRDAWSGRLQPSRYAEVAAELGLD